MQKRLDQIYDKHVDGVVIIDCHLFTCHDDSSMLLSKFNTMSIFLINHHNGSFSVSNGICIQLRAAQKYTFWEKLTSLGLKVFLYRP